MTTSTANQLGEDSGDELETVRPALNPDANDIWRACGYIPKVVQKSLWQRSLLAAHQAKTSFVLRMHDWLRRLHSTYREG